MDIIDACFLFTVLFIYLFNGIILNFSLYEMPKN